MTALDVLRVCSARGVRLVIGGDELRAQGKPGAVNEVLRAALAEHKAALIELLGDGVTPDETLPDVITYPASLPGTIEAFRACLEAQRIARAA